MNIPTSDITGLLLAGGRGSRMGGVDKGLEMHLGLPLAQHALRRLAPQVGPLMINANRNLATYHSMGFPVIPDEVPEYPGPLAGMLAGLTHCKTAYLVTIPCDTPNFPIDLVDRLKQELLHVNADIATAYTREGDSLFAQPVFCLMKATLRESLHAFVTSGQRKTGLFASQHRGAAAIFDDTSAFFNIKTPAELEQLQPRS